MPYSDEGIGHRDTDTSREAAKKVAPAARTIRDRILKIMSAWPGPMTADEISQQTGIYFGSVRPRISELRRDGLIEDSGERRDGEHGMKLIAWRLKGAQA